jgi:hypothetical protein
MRRLRKTGAVDPTTGEVVVIPRLPSVTGANKPPGWDRWSPAEKVQHLLGLSLDRMHACRVRRPPAEPPPPDHRLACLRPRPRSYPRLRVRGPRFRRRCG